MIRRFLSKRFVRILLWLFITLVTLVVLLYVWTNWSGRRRWAATTAMLEREGETLDFRKLLPETPPPAQNLLAIEPLDGITETVDHDESKGAPGAKRKALAEMKLNSVAPHSRGVETGSGTDMQRWAAYLRESKFLDLPAEPATIPEPGAAVLKALDARFPVLRQLADLAPQRSQAMFTPGMRERELPEMLFALALRHYAGAQNLARLLCLRARAAMDAKLGAEAMRSLLAAEKIAIACESEPLLIGCLVGFAAESMVNESLWEGLRQRLFTDAELQTLQSLIGSHDLDKVLLQAFRGERACAVSSLGWMQNASGSRKSMPSKEFPEFANEIFGLSLRRIKIVPDGLFHHWMSVIAEMEWKYAVRPLRDGGIREALKEGVAMKAELDAHESRPDYYLPRMALPAFSTVCANAAMVQARQHQVLAAIALERFFLKHGKYPATLRELVPEWIPAVPLDPLNGREMNYHTTAAGRYTLWCVGIDGKDDEGQVNKNGVAMRSHMYLGDWTWSYEPVKMDSKK